MKDFIIPDDATSAPPPRSAKETVTLTIDGFAVTVPEGTSIMRAAAEAGIQVPKLCATDMRRGLRLVPPVPGRDRGPRRHARRPAPRPSRRAWSSTPRPPKVQAAAPGRDGAVHLGPPAGLPDLLGQRRLRIAGHGRRRRPARCALRGEATPISSRAGHLGRRPTRSGCPRTTATPISPMTRRNASSARAACAPARRCRAPSR